MPTLPAKPRIALDGSLTDWIASERIDYNDLSGYSFYAQPQDDRFYFALSAPTAIGPNTTFWLNTDQNTATGYQIFGNAGGAEYNVNIKSDGTAALYSGAAGQTLVLDNLQIAYSADRRTIEFAIPKAAIGTPSVIKTLFDVNDTVFGPTNYSAQPYIAYDNNVSRTESVPQDRHRLLGDNCRALFLAHGLLAAIHGGAKPSDAGRDQLRHVRQGHHRRLRRQRRCARHH